VRLTMVARDVAPSRAFELVGGKLGNRVDVARHLGHGKPLSSLPEKIVEDVQNSNLVLLGMSCSEDLAKEELLAAKVANMAGVPYGFYADMFGCSAREWFAPFRQFANFIFVLSEEEAWKTRPLFPNAEIVVSGNPVIEESFWSAKKAEETRALLGINAGDLLMYVTAGKDLEVNKAHFSAVLAAVASLPDRDRWVVQFMLHPGDQNHTSHYLKLLPRGLIAFLNSAAFIKGLGLSALDVIAACDLMVASVSTSGIEAACLRKPVIDNLPPLSVARMKEQTGSDIWPPCEFGISRAVMGDPAELAKAIQELMAPGGFDEMRARQEACFPAPEERDAAVKIMTESLLRFLE